jgi:hypothetical protein
MASVPSRLRTPGSLAKSVFKHAFIFFRDWLPIFAVYLFYEAIRGHAYIIQNLLHISVHKTLLIKVELTLFGKIIPTLIFQQFHNGNIVLDYAAILIYTSMFWGGLLLGVFIWRYDRQESFRVFRISFLILMYSALFVHILFPAYPPWLAAKEGYLPQLISPWNNTAFGEKVTLLTRYLGRNDVAPMPSLHAASALLYAIILDSLLRRRYGLLSKLSYIYPLTMAMVILYTGDHYLIDVIVAIPFAFGAAYIGSHHPWFSRLAYRLNPFKKPEPIASPGPDRL